MQPRGMLIFGWATKSGGASVLAEILNSYLQQKSFEE